MKEPTARDIQIRRVIENNGGNVREAAEFLGEPVSRLYWNLRTDRQHKWWLAFKEKKKLASKKAQNRRKYLRRKQRLLEMEAEAERLHSNRERYYSE